MLPWCSGLAYTHIIYTYANILNIHAYQILEEGAHHRITYNGKVNQVIIFIFYICVYKIFLVSLDGQDTRFSPWRPGFDSRTRNTQYIYFDTRIKKYIFSLAYKIYIIIIIAFCGIRTHASEDTAT